MQRWELFRYGINDFFILQDLDDSCVISCHDCTLHDGCENERNVLAVEIIGIVSTLNVSDEAFDKNDEKGTEDLKGNMECNIQHRNGWKPPEGWKHALRSGEPEFCTIDNLGN